MTLRTLNYGNYGIFLIMGNAGFCPSTVVPHNPSPHSLLRTRESCPEAYCKKEFREVAEKSKTLDAKAVAFGFRAWAFRDSGFRCRGLGVRGFEVAGLGSRD